MSSCRDKGLPIEVRGARETERVMAGGLVGGALNAGCSNCGRRCGRCSPVGRSSPVGRRAPDLLGLGRLGFGGNAGK